MATAPRKCRGLKGKMCNCFLSSTEKDYHDVCVGGCGQQFSVDAQCESRKVGTTEEWEVVQAYIVK